MGAAVDRLVELASVRVMPHTRLVNGKLVKVSGYTKEIPDVDPFGPQEVGHLNPETSLEKLMAETMVKDVQGKNKVREGDVHSDVADFLGAGRYMPEASTHRVPCKGFKSAGLGNCYFNVGSALADGLPSGWSVAAGIWMPPPEVAMFRDTKTGTPLPDLIWHVWLVNDKGEAVDPTLSSKSTADHRGGSYYGVAIPEDVARRDFLEKGEFVHVPRGMDEGVWDVGNMQAADRDRILGLVEKKRAKLMRGQFSPAIEKLVRNFQSPKVAKRWNYKTRVWE